MSPRKFARRLKDQATPDCSTDYGSLCRGCALSRAGARCVPPDFHAHKECRILAAGHNGYSHFPFMVIDADSYHVRLANLATGIRVPIRAIKCFELSHKRSRPCGECDYSCPMAKIKRSGQPVTAIHDHFDSSGEERTYQVHAYPVFNEDGDVIQIIEFAYQSNETDLEETLPDPVAQYVLPMVRTLAGTTGPVEPEFVERLARCLNLNFSLPRDAQLRSGIGKLSFDDRFLCRMIYHDLSSREMALLSGKKISQINNQRHRIRRQLGLARSPINLNHYLQTRW